MSHKNVPYSVFDTVLNGDMEFQAAPGTSSTPDLQHLYEVMDFNSFFFVNVPLSTETLKVLKKSDVT